MSTFLAGVQKLAREAGAAGVPSTVVSQTGESKRLVDWYIDAYTEIQNRHKWKWMRYGFTVDTTSGDDSYAYGDCTDLGTSAPITRFNDWRLNDDYDPPKIYLTSAGVGGERWLIYTAWDDFKRVYKIGAQSANTGAPAHITVDPQNNIMLGPSPNGIYTLTGDYYRSDQVLAADADVPEMPTQFHNLIVYKALEKYARYEEAQLLFNMASVEVKRLTRQLERNQMAGFGASPPLA